MTFTRVSAAAVTTELDHFLHVSVRFQLKETSVLLFLLTYSDPHVEGTETLSFVPETRFFQLFSVYRALSALVIPDLSFSLQVS